MLGDMFFEFHLQIPVFYFTNK